MAGARRDRSRPGYRSRTIAGRADVRIPQGAPGTNDDLACAGWLARFGADHLGVRLAVANGRLPATALAPGENWPPLHHTWRDVVREQHQG